MDIERIDNISDEERIKLIQEFRKSIEEVIPQLGKKDLDNLENQLSRFCKSKKFLMYVCFHDDEYIISTGLGVDYFLKKKFTIS